MELENLNRKSKTAGFRSSRRSSISYNEIQRFITKKTSISRELMLLSVFTDKLSLGREDIT
ncbi:hypothetical protein TRIP_D310089 [uncultured Paludibacter sp.]|uniref:Uncharacterized protein n=1 Tax=uncultured Paludibacter sp. TaxID=497635 RepID=A0A653ACI8_9BACT|nr:hypothetical protein TRIP_D310089 [uncultured Paludibacter sp.]